MQNKMDMEATQVHDVCSAKHAGMLDNKFRRLTQNPAKVLKPYVRNDMKVMDLGCGPGFFTMEMAHLVGDSGKVTAVDLQHEMLNIVDSKVKKYDLQSIVHTHQCSADSIGVSETYDFILAYYVIHEIPDKEKLWKEVKSLLKPGGKMLVVEPAFHVNGKVFSLMKEQITNEGLMFTQVKANFMNRAILVSNNV